MRVYDYETDADSKQKRVLNKKETTLAQQKQEQIKTAFKDWLWKGPERRQTLVQLYNELYNSNRPREYDGSHVTFSGISPEITMRQHQLNVVAHGLYGDNLLSNYTPQAKQYFGDVDLQDGSYEVYRDLKGGISLIIPQAAPPNRLNIVPFNEGAEFSQR